MSELRKAAQVALDSGGIITANIAQQLRAALADPQPEPVARKVDAGFRWDGANQQHIPTLTVEFDPVPANAPNDSKGWADRDATAAMLKAPQAQQPLTREQIDAVWSAQGSFTDRESDYRCFARAIERAHGIGKP